MDEQVSSEEDNVEYHPEDTDTSDESDEEVTGAEAAPAPAETFKSKSGNICWTSVPPDVHGRASAANVIKMTSGITRLAVTRSISASILHSQPCLNINQHSHNPSEAT
ncbi:piggyBac transposable element-derived protein 4-like protein [Lates japonicus]|uniref:PiggyBac transposable element-derived protein 4-like protein n=1 Tax=Lates japonicus TaxID=270547 RepID=A0AAD3N0V4_LATJO|nr:piggyBac transposable element-derived protein 4-like protein [Lates japonicus]